MVHEYSNHDCHTACHPCLHSAVSSALHESPWTQNHWTPRVVPASCVVDVHAGDLAYNPSLQSTPISTVAQQDLTASTANNSDVSRVVDRHSWLHHKKMLRRKRRLTAKSQVAMFAHVGKALLRSRRSSAQKVLKKHIWAKASLLELAIRLQNRRKSNAKKTRRSSLPEVAMISSSGHWLESLPRNVSQTQSCEQDECSHHNQLFFANRVARSERKVCKVRSKRAKKALLALLACKLQKRKNVRPGKRLHKTSQMQLDADTLGRKTLSAARQQASAVRRECRRSQKRQRAKQIGETCNDTAQSSFGNMEKAIAVLSLSACDELQRAAV